jgi:hypothetical protein
MRIVEPGARFGRRATTGLAVLLAVGAVGATRGFATAGSPAVVVEWNQKAYDLGFAEAQFLTFKGARHRSCHQARAPRGPAHPGRAPPARAPLTVGGACLGGPGPYAPRVN